MIFDSLTLWFLLAALPGHRVVYLDAFADGPSGEAACLDEAEQQKMATKGQLVPDALEYACLRVTARPAAPDPEQPGP